MAQVTGVLIDVKGDGTAKMTTIENELDEYYRILKCDIFDIISLRIGKHRYDIYCDDNGLLKTDKIISAVDCRRNPMLVGNLFVTKTNEEGETISLSEEEIKEVLANTKNIIDVERLKTYTVLVCEYN